jgi:hypothetical protein
MKEIKLKKNTYFTIKDWEIHKELRRRKRKERRSYVLFSIHLSKNSKECSVGSWNILQLGFFSYQNDIFFFKFD